MSAAPPTSAVKRIAHAVFPTAYCSIRSWWHQRQGRRFNSRYEWLVDEYARQTGLVIQSGPFKGIRYIREAKSSALLPKVAGTYELEIFAEVERAIATNYPVIVDIGCAEGYYAVGMAKRCPNSLVKAFDADPGALELCRSLARENNVNKDIQFFGAFSEDSLSQLPPESRFFVICDVDGLEATLFNNRTSHLWKHADLIVELHDFLGLNCRANLVETLSFTHSINIVETRPRTLADAPTGIDLSTEDTLLSVDELRPRQSWALVRSNVYL